MTMFRVVDAAGKGDMEAKMADIEAYIARYPTGVTEPRLFDKFVKYAVYSTRDIDNLLDYLLRSGRIIRVPGDKNRPAKYLVNGGKE